MSVGYRPGGSGGGGGGTGPQGPPGPPGFTLTPTVKKVFADSPFSAAANTVIPVDTTGGNMVVNLPPTPANLTMVEVKHVIRGGTNTVTVNCGGTDVFNKTGGATSNTITLVDQAGLYEYEAATGIWYILNADHSLGQLDLRFARLLDIIVTPKTGNYTAAANEFALFDTTSGSCTLTLPTTPANGTMVGARVVVLAAGTSVSVTCGTGDHFNTATGPTSASGALAFANQSVVYLYKSGVWETVSSVLPLISLDARYGLTTVGEKTANYTANINEFVPCNATSVAFTVTLPTTPITGGRVGVSLLAGANAVTITAGGSDVIGRAGGSASKTLNLVGQSCVLHYNGAGVWIAISDTSAFNQVGPGANTTLGTAVNGIVPVNVNPTDAAIWTPQFTRLASNSSPVNNSQTPLVSTGLTAALDVSSTYKFDIILYVDTSEAADVRINFTGPTGYTGDYMLGLDVHTTQSGSAIVAVSGGLNSATRLPFKQLMGGGDVQLGSNPSGTPLAHRISGHVTTDATHPGTLTLVFAQVTPTAVNTFIAAGSSIECRKMP